MTVDDKIRDEKSQYDINREAAKISASSSGKIDKYEFLTGEEMLPSNQSRIIEQAKFTYSPLGKAFEKQTKTIEEQGKKEIKAIKVIKNDQIINNKIIMNYCFQRKEKYLRIFILKDSIKKMNYLKKLIMVT